ncbi:MAG: AAA family ATPase [Planctomycetota bacterium]|nr:AAA family ATPase [Planctomycetota bacterium]
MLYLSRIQLRNVRCFEKLTIKLTNVTPSAGWTVFVGDNATGKSTLLRSVALGLCDEASAAGLLKESDEGYIRRGQTEARITLDLHDPNYPKRVFRITTRILRKKGRHGIFSDIVRQSTTPRREEFPWDEIFVSAYGAGRGVAGAGDVSAYSAIDAVYNMFNYAEGLQNPELTIRRLTASRSKSSITDRDIFRAIENFTGTQRIRMTSRGILIDGPWGDGMPLRDLADGYKSTFAWLTDMIGWALAFKPKLRTTAGIHGIVLLDEIEQHLHVRWQRTAIDVLRHAFPNVQFFAATHSPLIASSVGHYESMESIDHLYVLELDEERHVSIFRHEFMMGWRMDQVLASRAFKHQVHADPQFRRILRRGSELAGKKKRTKKERSEYLVIKNTLRNAFFNATTPVGRAAEVEARGKLREELVKLQNELFGSEES